MIAKRFCGSLKNYTTTVIFMHTALRRNRDTTKKENKHLYIQFVEELENMPSTAEIHEGLKFEHTK